MLEWRRKSVFGTSNALFDDMKLDTRRVPLNSLLGCFLIGDFAENGNLTSIIDDLLRNACRFVVSADDGSRFGDVVVSSTGDKGRATESEVGGPFLFFL